MEILTQQLEQGVPLGRESSRLHIYGGLETPVSDDVLRLTPKHKAAIESFTEQCLAAYGPLFADKEATRAQNEHGVPTLVARVDCTVNDGKLAFYEVEDSPSGLGITDTLMRRSNGVGIREQVQDHFIGAVGALPRVIVSSKRSHGTDDAMIFGDDLYHYSQRQTLPTRPIDDDEPVIVKAIPGDHLSARPYTHLTAQTLAPLATEGDKTYLLRTGMCKVVTDQESLLTKNGDLQSQVVKAAIGSMAMGVSIFLNPRDREMFGKQGTVKEGRLLRDVAEYVARDGYALTQPFAPPIQVTNPEGRTHAILRVFTLISGDGEGDISAEAIGGCYVARPELVVHGASNSVGGAVLV